jgi:hypothetical protein
LLSLSLSVSPAPSSRPNPNQGKSLCLKEIKLKHIAIMASYSELEGLGMKIAKEVSRASFHYRLFSNINNIQTSTHFTLPRAETEHVDQIAKEVSLGLKSMIRVCTIFPVMFFF